MSIPSPLLALAAHPDDLEFACGTLIAKETGRGAISTSEAPSRPAHCIAGMGEQAYLNKSETPEITFLNRDPIDRLDEAWTETP